MNVSCVHLISYQEFLTKRYEEELTKRYEEEQEEKRRRKNERMWRYDNNYEKKVKRIVKGSWIFILIAIPVLVVGYCIKYTITSAGAPGEGRVQQQPRAVSLPTLGETETAAPTAPSLESPEIVPTAPQVRVL